MGITSAECQHLAVTRVSLWSDWCVCQACGFGLLSPRLYVPKERKDDD
jgi:hypothetical protein